jgi:hypothetical protein
MHTQGDLMSPDKSLACNFGFTARLNAAPILHDQSTLDMNLPVPLTE